MDENMKEFVAYLRRLKRDLEDIKDCLNSGDTETAADLIQTLINDTQNDIET